MKQPTVHDTCLKIRAVRPRQWVFRTAQYTQPLVSLEMLDRSLTWAKMQAVKDTINRMHTPLKTHP